MIKNILKVVLVVLFSIGSLYGSGDKYPLFEMKDVDGNVVKIQALQHTLKVVGAENKIVLIEFFGYVCPPCLQTIPHLIELKNKYKDKIEIIAIEVPMNVSAPYAPSLRGKALKKFVSQKGINYHVISDKESYLFTDYISQAAGWNGGIPFMMVLGKGSQVEFMQVGFVPASALEYMMEDLSKQK